MTTNIISETVSEKPKRGRPKAWSDSWHDIAKIGATKAPKTRRGQQNFLYALRAFGVLRDADANNTGRFQWLGLIGLNDDQPKNWRLFTELGRISDDEEIVLLADLLCEHKLCDQRAVNYVHDARLGKTSVTESPEALDANSGKLLRALARTIDAHRRRHPDFPRYMIAPVVERLLETVSEMDARQESGRRKLDNNRLAS